MIVADASVIVELLLQSTHAQRVRERLFPDDDSEVHAPHLVDVEVAHVIRRYVLNGEVEAHRGEQLLVDFLDLPLNRYPHGMLMRRIWELRENLSAYDASYIALAEVLDATMVTRDRRLESVPGIRAAVEVI